MEPFGRSESPFSREESEELLFVCLFVLVVIVNVPLHIDTEFWMGTTTNWCTVLSIMAIFESMLSVGGH